MDTLSIAKDFVAILQQGHWEEAGAKYWAPGVVSTEAMADMPPSVGIEAVKGKGAWWRDNHEVHGATVLGPFVNGDSFAVRFTIDVTPKATGQRMTMDEVGVYALKDGKIVEEKFFYAML